MRARRLLVAAAPAVALAVALALAGASCGDEEPGLPPQPARPTIVQDDALALHRSDAQTADTMRDLRALGADWLRVTAGWSAIAPAAGSPRRPPGFDATDPDAYPPGAWDRLDRAVRLAREHGLRVMIDVAFWAPRWATRRPSDPPERQRTDIDPAAYADFAEAVARRYGDRAAAYAVWNEPNHPAFLLPQWRRTGDRWTVDSARQYRAMLLAAHPRLKAAAPDVPVLVGNTSGLGVDAADDPGDKVAPLRFLRELACVDDRLRPLDTPDCRPYRPLPGDGWGHHPYSVSLPPWQPDPQPDNVRMADLSRLADTLDRLAAAGRTEKRLGVWVTEYGYQTDPPDPTQPTDTAEQARWLPEADLRIASDPRVRSFAQFLLRDLPPRPAPTTAERWGDFQTGLRFPDGRAKPAERAFAHGLVAQRAGPGRVRFWIHVRAQDGQREVRIAELQPDRTWSPLPSFGIRRTDEDGMLGATVVADPGGTYRLEVHHDGDLSVGEPVTGAR